MQIAAKGRQVARCFIKFNMDLREATKKALERLQWEFGIWASPNVEDRRIVFEGAYGGLKRLGATGEDVEKALDELFRKWDTTENKPRALHSMYLVSLVRGYMTRQKLNSKEPERESRSVTGKEFKDFLDYCKAAYLSGGRKWAIVRAGCGWMVDRLNLDYSQYMDKAAQRTLNEKREEAIGLGLILDQISIAADQDRVTAEAKRMAMQEYFKQKA